MRSLLILAVASLPLVAQSPAVKLTNVSQPAEKNFQSGDRFEVVITGGPNQPVSVRSTKGKLTDWGPVIGLTDIYGRWSVAGTIRDEDVGFWDELWTVGNRLASPEVRFEVNVSGARECFASATSAEKINCPVLFEGDAVSCDPFWTPVLADSSDNADLKRKIDETMAYVLAR